MLGFFTVLAYFISLMPLALANRVFYALDRRRCLWINRRLSTVCAHRVFALTETYMDFRFTPEGDLGASLPDRFMVVSNHQSLLDIPLYMNYFNNHRLRFVAKAELGRGIPIVSVMLRSDGHCLVKRTGSPTQAMKAMDSFADRVRENDWIPVLFPEGTRSRNGAVGTFHAAGFRRFIARNPMPVAVCALDGVWHISSLFGLAKNLRGGKYRVKILKVYPAPTTKAEQLTILEEGKALIEAQLAEWQRIDGR